MARVVLDLDGTLVHSVPTMTAAANAMLAELGRPPATEATLTGFVGQGTRRLVERLLERTGGPPAQGVDHAHARYRAIYGAEPVAGTEPYPGAAAALEVLAAAGHGLAVCTQKPNAHALAILRALRLMPPVVGFAGGDSLPALKPDPRLFRHAADALPPGREIMVGDSEIDAATARAAGAAFILHLRGYGRLPPHAVGADAAFSDFAELPGIVAALDAAP